jgi:hypothetical protein
MKFLLIVSLSLLTFTSALVFRGGTMSARVESFHSTNLTIEFIMRMFWESSFSNRGFCQPGLNITCDVGGLITSFQYQYPCPSRSNCSTLINYCSTNCYQNTSEYFYGIKKYYKTFYIGTLGVFLATFAGRSREVSWIQLDGGGSGGIWRQRIRYDTISTSKYGGINRTPKALMPHHLIRVPRGKNSSIPIGYVDFDGDIVRCRWSINSSEECGGVCQSSPEPPVNRIGSPAIRAIPFADLNSNECFLDLNLYNTSFTGRFAVAIQIEDFDLPASLSPLSSVPFQFLIEVTDAPLENCSLQPRFLNEFSQCQVISIGKRWCQVFQVTSNCSNMIKIDIIGLENALVTQINDSLYNLSWLPTQDDFGSHRVCILASDSLLNSNFICLTLHSGSSAPQIQKNQSFHVNLKNDSTYNWVIEFNQPIELRNQSGLIRFYSSNGQLILTINSSRFNLFERNRKISFITNFSFVPDNYYALFDADLAVGRWNCRLASEEVKDSTYWSFIVKSTQEALKLQQESASNDQTALIIGITVGFIVLLLLVVIIFYLRICQKKIFRIN